MVLVQWLYSVAGSSSQVGAVGLIHGGFWFLCINHVMILYYFTQRRKTTLEWSHTNDFAGVHDIVRVESSLQLPHDTDPKGAKLLLQQLHLALSYAMFPRTSSSHGQCPPMDVCMRTRDSGLTELMSSR